jgi:hypothetical protein
MSKCIIVLGCYRTGSSAVAGILHHLGVMMGKRFDIPNQNNPKGYFEDLDFKELHKETDFDFDCYLYLIRKREKLPIWGVKDPRLCMYFSTLVSNLSCENSVISITRPEEDICRSLEKAIGRTEYKYLIRYYCDLNKIHLSEYPGRILHLEFNDIMANREKAVKQIAEFAGMPVTESALKFFCQ